MANYLPKRIDMTGRRFSRLVVTSFSHKQGKIVYWRCLCDCGNETVVRRGNLTNLSIKSCGCLQRENRIKQGHANRTHGWYGTREYHSWQSMKQRCYNENHTYYKYYGGKGIRVCKRWLYSFENFLADMGSRPKGKSLDRKNNKKNYTKNNCRWATRLQQNRNRTFV